MLVAYLCELDGEDSEQRLTGAFNLFLQGYFASFDESFACGDSIVELLQGTGWALGGHFDIEI